MNQDRARRIWLGPDATVNQTVLFRKRFNIQFQNGTKPHGLLRLFADAQYLLWINGRLLDRGPTFFHPHRRPLQCYRLDDLLVPGANALAVLVHHPGISTHNYICSQCPGLVAEMEFPDADGCRLIVSDAEWKALRGGGWSENTPRRSWAIGFVEDFDAADAPAGWQEPGFDDSTWPFAEERPHFREGQSGNYVEVQTPPLRFYWQPAISICGFYRADQPAHPLKPDDPTSAFGQSLAEEPWTGPEGIRLDGEPDAQGGGMQITGLDGHHGAALILDLGEEYIGACSFELECESTGSVDIGWGECLEATGRPAVFRKGNSYADRYHAIPGKNTWLPRTFNAGRYLLLVFRGFNGAVTLHRTGMLASEPDCRYQAHFRTPEHPRLESIWQFCERTLRRGTQEGLMDCPTREQAAYVGDGNPNAAWFARLCGDFNHWRRLVQETFAVQSEEGHIKTMVFSGMNSILLDYSLLSVINARDYWLATGDKGTLCQILNPCRKLMKWFEERCNENGLFSIPWEAFNRKAGFLVPPQNGRIEPDDRPVGTQAIEALRDPGWNLFIDHPGMGWHNVSDPGIDRRGQNTAINALHIMALRAMAALLEANDEPEATHWIEQADRKAQTVHRLFWNESENAYADGRLDGELLPQISQQTNTWCIMAGICPQERIQEVWQRILDPEDRNLARSGPYFWSYMLPAMAEAGLVGQALAEIERLYSDMLDRGASLVWETFAGDHLDSRCHPWSCAPLDFLLRHIAGIGDLPPGETQLELRPRTDLLPELDAVACTAQGPVHIRWQTTDGTARITAEGPQGIQLKILTPPAGSGG